MKAILTISLILLAVYLNAQTSTFRWGDVLIEYESVFDSTKVTRHQLENAYLLVILDEFSIFNTQLASRIERINQLNFYVFKHKYNAKKQKLLAIELPKGKTWQGLRQEKLKEMEQIFELGRITHIATTTDWHKILLQSGIKDSCLTFYSEALIAGGDSLLKAWHYLTSQRASQNASPARIWADYRLKLKSDHKFLHAKVYVLTYGWWNCVIKHINYFDREKAVKEFEKLFVKTRVIYAVE